MKYRKLSVCCECGRCANQIKNIGFTAEHELVLHWWCSGCKRTVYLVKPLSDCWRHCPETENLTNGEEAGRLAFGPDDTSFLRSLGVSLLAEE